MTNLIDLEKKINSELTTKINKTEIKHDQIYIEIDKDDLNEVVTFLKTNKNTKFKQLIDITVVDYPENSQRFKLVYNIKGTKLAPAVSTEYFYHLTRQLNKLRHSIVLSYPVSKKIDFDLGYRFQHEINIARPKNLFILDAKLNYSF